MKTEKLRLKADYLLLGKRGVTRGIILFLNLLRLLSAALLALGIINVQLLYFSFPALGAVYLIVNLLLRILIWCAELFRDRWFMLTANKSAVTVSELLASFSFVDVWCAVRLALALRLYCFVRCAVFLFLPSCALFLSFLYTKTGVSGAVLSVLVCGNILLVMLAAFFCSAALCTVFSAAQLSCLDCPNVLSGFCRRLKILDNFNFSLLNFKLFFTEYFSLRKQLAERIYLFNMVLAYKKQGPKY